MKFQQSYNFPLWIFPVDFLALPPFKDEIARLIRLYSIDSV